MAIPTVLDAQHLRLACSRLLDEVEARYGGQIESPNLSEYWQVNLGDAYALVSSPSVEAGDFGDDLTELSNVPERPDSEIVLWHDLDHLAGVPRGIAFMDLPK